jgi:tRNA dimethylallyltransferase
MKRDLVIAIVGPTCTGKTTIGIELAKLVNGEIVSADSRQIYKLIDIGTAKPTPDELAAVPHHLVDMVPLDECISAGTYGGLARQAIGGIFSRNRVPILVGGSGLYIRSVIDGLFDAPEIDERTRRVLRSRLESEGAERLLEELKGVDPEAAKGLLPGNYKRILRALEVFYSTGNRISRLRLERGLPPAFKTLQFGIAVERKELYRRIEKRVDDMLAAGFLDEVKELLRRGFDPKLNSLQTVGYKEAIRYVQQRITFEDMVEQFKMNTRRYAKRQMTWFRKDPRIIWMNADGKSAAEVAREISGAFAWNG